MSNSVNLNDKDFFKEIEKIIKENYDSIPDGFPHFCMQIFWDNLSDDDIHAAITGLESNDDSIDAFFIDEDNKKINIIQCKSRVSFKGNSPLKKEWLSYLSDAPNKLRDINYINKHKNDRIKEISEDFALWSAENGFKVNLYLFHLGKPQSRNILDHYSNIIYYDFSAIKDKYEEYKSKLDRTEPDSIEIKLNENTIEPNINKNHNTLVSIISGDELIKLRETHRYKLFDKNLRFALGDNKINKEISNTATGDPKNFYFYNNGITITSKNFRYKSNSKLTIEYPQIINGAQTVSAIYKSYCDAKSKIKREQAVDATEASIQAREKFKDVRVLFRVIQDSEKDGRKTSEFENRVIKYNNSQNSAKETDFYANEPEQIKIQEIMAKYGYFYEIKRGDREFLKSNKEHHNLLNKKRENFKYWDEKIDMAKLASAWMAFRVSPIADDTRKANIFGHAGDKHYDAIFERADNIDNALVAEMILAVNLLDCIQKQANIYGSSKNKGQILSKVAKIDANTGEKFFTNVKEIVQGCCLFGKQVKAEFNSLDEFIANKDTLLEKIDEYHFFSMGKHYSLAIFSRIISKCGYTNKLIDESLGLFCNKKFLKESLVEPWLPMILSRIIKPEYEYHSKNSRVTLKNFYDKQSIWEAIEKRFEKLKYESDMDKPYNEIFRLEICSKET